MKNKDRLDICMVKLGLAKSRDHAKALIMSGKVFYDGEKAYKSSEMVFPTSKIVVNRPKEEYVSRGGYKLAKLIKNHGINLTNKICCDIGASTGGFTDCMLQNGAQLVYAVDVGYGQLDWKLRTDSRVICLEKTNARYLTTNEIKLTPHFITIDVSFISLTLILKSIVQLLKDGGEIVGLIKPQFEAGRAKVEKNGVIKSKSTHKEVIEKVSFESIEIGLHPIDIDYSPIKGPKGNIEYLIYLKKRDLKDIEKTQVSIYNDNYYQKLELEITSLVNKAHDELK